MLPETVRAVLPHLRSTPRAVVRLLAWSVPEMAQTFFLGYALARALDDGFLRGEPGAGMGWLAAAGLSVVLAGVGTDRVHVALAAIAEPMRDDLIRRVVHRALRDADGAAVSRLTHQTEIARDTFANLLLVSRTFVLSAGAALAGLLALAPVLLLIVLPPLAAGLVLFVATLRPLARRQEAFLVADEVMAADVGAAVAGLRDIAASGAQPWVAADAGAGIDGELRAARALARWGTLRDLAVGVAGHLPVVLLLGTAPWLLGRGVTPGALVAALAYLTQALLPALENLILSLGTTSARLAVVLRRLAPEGTCGTTRRPTSAQEAGHPATLQRARQADAMRTATGLGPGRQAHTQKDAFTAVPETGQADFQRPESNLAPTRHPHDAAASPPAVSLHSLTFAYGPHAEPVLRGLDLALPPGGHLAVAGPSGIGKSTLAALIAGVLVPDQGEVRLCGRDVRELGPGGLAALRVLVPQEAYVFSGTVGENIAYLCPEPPSDAALLASCAAVGADGLVGRLGGPEARLDPRALSAGERQLLALARAHLASAPLVLLDEATCHLDPAAEARAEQAFLARPGGSLIVVAHRISSARRAARILVMDGTDTDCGTHEDLLARSPLYRDLVGSWADRSHPALLQRDAYGVDPVTGAGLTGDGRHVVAHGPGGQVEPVSDLRDRGTFHGQ
ncbi:ABC-type multidrug transport system fused ATPase/permease subunit [Streptomyces sp. V4I8]|uniref:ATP-binding cassette domain-containing protein n=1 Tax=Streptomyces sp. V4I8 TaxID=3156469 RepID=UPI00351484DB